MTRTGAMLVAAAFTLAAGACGGSGSDAGEVPPTTAPGPPSACAEAPVTMDLRAGGDKPAGDLELTVVDAVARRVPILPGALAFDPGELGALESKAAITPLGAYVVYLADFAISPDGLEVNGPAEIVPGEGQTLAAITLVPTAETGFAQNMVVVDGPLDYETNTGLVPLTLTVRSSADSAEPMVSDMKGQLEILYLDDQTICVAYDMTAENEGEMVYRAAGVISMPVVDAPTTYFLT